MKITLQHVISQTNMSEKKISLKLYHKHNDSCFFLLYLFLLMESFNERVDYIIHFNCGMFLNIIY